MTVNVKIGKKVVKKRTRKYSKNRKLGVIITIIQWVQWADNFWVFSSKKNHGITHADIVIKFNVTCQCIIFLITM